VGLPLPYDEDSPPKDVASTRHGMIQPLLVCEQAPNLIARRKPFLRDLLLCDLRGCSLRPLRSKAFAAP
jgi:hypothetical protein